MVKFQYVRYLLPVCQMSCFWFRCNTYWYVIHYRDITNTLIKECNRLSPSQTQIDSGFRILGIFFVFGGDSCVSGRPSQNHKARCPPTTCKVGRKHPPIQLGFSSQISISFGTIHPWSLTWNLKMMVSNRDLLFQGLNFKCHVKLHGCVRFFSRQKNTTFLFSSSQFPASRSIFWVSAILHRIPKRLADVTSWMWNQNMPGGTFLIFFLNSLLGGRNETSCFVPSNCEFPTFFELSWS